MLRETLTARSSHTVIPVVVAAAVRRCPVPMGFVNPGKGSSEGRMYLRRAACACESGEREQPVPLVRPGRRVSEQDHT